MTPNDIGQVLDRLARIETKQDAANEAAARIEAKVQVTNGRVTELERAEIRRQTIWRIVRWVAGILTPLLTATLIALSNADKL